MPKFSLTFKSGRFATGQRLKSLVEQHCNPGIKAAGLDIIAGEHATTPIVTGYLRSHWDMSQPAWNGNVRRVTVKNDTKYARIVDLRSRRNRGYIKRGIGKQEASARNHLKQAVGALGPHLWEKK